MSDILGENSFLKNIACLTRFRVGVWLGAWGGIEADIEIGILAIPIHYFNSYTSAKANEYPPLFQARPTMAADAINSSIKAKDIFPDILCGFSSGKAEYFNKIEGLILPRLACPIVQPA